MADAKISSIEKTQPLKLFKPTPQQVVFYRRIQRLRPIVIGSAIKRVLSITRVPFATKEGPVLWIDPVSVSGLMWLENREYEPTCTALLRHWLGSGDTFFDVGANEGYFSMLAAALVQSGGAVHSWEPQSRLAEVLRRNIEANGADGIIHHHAVGLSEAAGMATLHLAPDVNTGASGFNRSWRFGAAMETIQLERLDDAWERLNRPQVRLMKIDCEGAEAKVIPGGKKILGCGGIDAIIVEYHPHIIGREQCHQLHQQIVGLGYQWRDCNSWFLYYLPKQVAHANTFQPPVEEYRNDLLELFQS